jgi:hypothetical protein
MIAMLAIAAMSFQPDALPLKVVRDVEVAISGVAVGPEEAASLVGEPRMWSKQIILIRLFVLNKSDTVKKTFEGWDGGRSNQLRARLSDDRNNTYEPLAAVVASPRGSGAKSFYPKQAKVAYLAFEPPVATASMLKLALPGKGVGLDADIEFSFSTKLRTSVLAAAANQWLVDNAPPQDIELKNILQQPTRAMITVTSVEMNMIVQVGDVVGEWTVTKINAQRRELTMRLPNKMTRVFSRPFGIKKGA